TLRAASEEGVELIVADGGSTEESVKISSREGVQVVHAPSGRAACLNAGAAAARGELLLFLHADTLLPEGYAQCVRRAMRAGAHCAGPFSHRLEPRLPGIGWVEWGANRRSRRRGLPYGDQALHMRKEVSLPSHTPCEGAGADDVGLSLAGV
ncbi:MAG: hypothetical protein SGPRY_010645, partial [Prymnesium sp.]